MKSPGIKASKAIAFCSPPKYIWSGRWEREMGMGDARGLGQLSASFTVQLQVSWSVLYFCALYFLPKGVSFLEKGQTCKFAENQPCANHLGAVTGISNGASLGENLLRGCRSSRRGRGCASHPELRHTWLSTMCRMGRALLLWLEIS